MPEEIKVVKKQDGSFEDSSGNRGKSRGGNAFRYLALAVAILGVCALAYLIGSMNGTSSPTPRTSQDTIEFAGYTWDVKSGDGELADPGPNYWDNGNGTVWVDTQGRLHLMIRNVAGKWYASEISMQEPLGYGKYVFTTDSVVDEYDKNIIAAMFLYSFTNEHIEVDLEYSRWGGNEVENGWFSVQPVSSRTQDSFVISNSLDSRLTNVIDWTPGRIFFQINDSSGVKRQWTYSGSRVPTTTYGPVAIINFWLYNPVLSDGKDAEFIVSDFKFIPDASS
jgi:hypothetical protein